MPGFGFGFGAKRITRALRCTELHFGKRSKFKLLTSKLPALFWLAVPGTVQFNRPFRRV